MRKIKLSGRELSVLRAIDFATGSTGAELETRTRLEPEELSDIVNAFLDAGFVETNPPSEKITVEQLAGVKVEINPGYSHDLSDAIRRRY